MDDPVGAACADRRLRAPRGERRDDRPIGIVRGTHLGLVGIEVRRSAHRRDARDLAEPRRHDERRLRAGRLATEAQRPARRVRELLPGGVDDVPQPGRAGVVVQRNDLPAARAEHLAGHRHERLLGLRAGAAPATAVDHDHRAALAGAAASGGAGTLGGGGSLVGMIGPRRPASPVAAMERRPMVEDPQFVRDAVSARPRPRGAPRGPYDIRSNRLSHICARGRRAQGRIVAIMAPWNNAYPTDSSAPAFRATGVILAGSGHIRHAGSSAPRSAECGGGPADEASPRTSPDS